HPTRITTTSEALIPGPSWSIHRCKKRPPSRRVCPRAPRLGLARFGRRRLMRGAHPTRITTTSDALTLAPAGQYIVVKKDRPLVGCAPAHRVLGWQDLVAED